MLDYHKAVSPPQEPDNKEKSKPDDSIKIMEQNRWMHDPVTMMKLTKFDEMIKDLEQTATYHAMQKDSDGMSAKHVLMKHLAVQLKGVLTNV